MFSDGFLHLDTLVMVNQQKHTFSSSAWMPSSQLARQVLTDRDGWQERIKEICAVGMS